MATKSKKKEKKEDNETKASPLEKLKGEQAQLFSEMANIFAVFSAPVRLHLLHFLSQGPLSVEVLSHKIGQSIANTSLHLKKIQATKMVRVEVLGQKRLYHLNKEVMGFWEQCQDFLEDLNCDLRLPVEKVYGDINWNKSDEETKALIQKGKAAFVDVRPFDEHHLIQGMNVLTFDISFDKSIKDELKNLPRSKILLVFCRGRMCALSAHAVHLLRENNFKAYRVVYSAKRIQQIFNKESL
jgi:DNA-binding transcriptional ArsR family regulator/rhodanese-related sulfurtransferase